MIFNSYIFIFGFLPITLLGFYLLGGRGHHGAAMSWLVLSSLFFYGWWNPAYLIFIAGSIVFNYTMGMALEKSAMPRRKRLFIMGIVINLGFLGYFKYANFFIDNVNTLFDAAFHLKPVVLPLAISFFTFTQIAYLADAYEGKTHEHNFLHYCLFVVFFPHLIAGPIVHHKQIMPQFAGNTIYNMRYGYLMVGLTIFTLGLFKKVVIADNICDYVYPIFSAAEQGIDLTFFEAWLGSAAFAFQLYFDFSGYSDMAIGIAYLFGIRFPVNFNSPYKAVNIIDFWGRWHITLSRFLRDYVYIPLGGNRKGTLRRYVNLMLTMLIGGFWHGAGWTFIAWGALHGFYLVVNHAWQALRCSLGHDLSRSSWIGRSLAKIITLLAVTLGWAFFRAESFAGAMNMVSSMLGMRGISLPVQFRSGLGEYHYLLSSAGIRFDGMFYNHLVSFQNAITFIACLLLIVWFAPNVQQMMHHYHPVLESLQKPTSVCRYRWLQWRPRLSNALMHIIVLAVTIMLMQGESEFLYFQF